MMHRKLATAVGVLGLMLVLVPAARAQGPTKEPTFQDRPLSAWVEDLQGLAPYTRNQAAYAIANMGPAAVSAVPALIAALGDPEASVRFPVCIAFREIGPAAKDAVPALTKALEDRNEDVAAMARKAIIKITGEDPLSSED